MIDNKTVEDEKIGEQKTCKQRKSERKTRASVENVCQAGIALELHLSTCFSSLTSFLETRILHNLIWTISTNLIAFDLKIDAINIMRSKNSVFHQIFYVRLFTTHSISPISHHFCSIIMFVFFFILPFFSFFFVWFVSFVFLLRSISILIRSKFANNFFFLVLSDAQSIPNESVFLHAKH